MKPFSNLMASIKFMLSKIDGNVFTVVYFSIIAILVLINNFADEKKSTINAIIKNEMEDLNGTTRLFDDIIKLRNGETLKTSSSWLSFKQIQYSLKNKVFSLNKNDFASKHQSQIAFIPSATNDYYFILRNKIIIARGGNIENASISVIPETNNRYPSIVDPKRQLYYSNSSDFQYYPMKLNHQEKILVGLDLDLNNKFIFRDSAAEKFYDSSHFGYFTMTPRNLFTFSADSNVLFITPVFPPDGRSNQNKPTKLDLKESLDNIDGVDYIPVRLGPDLYTIMGSRMGRTKTLMLSHIRSEWKITNNKDFFPIYGTYNNIYFDSAGNLNLNNEGNRYALPLATCMKEHLIADSIISYYEANGNTDTFSIYALKGKGLSDGSIQGRYTLSKIARDGDNLLTVKGFAHKNFTGYPILLVNMFLLDSSDNRGLYAFDLDGMPYKTTYNDSILLGLINNGSVITTTTNDLGIMLFKLGDDGDFVLLKRNATGEITAEIVDGNSWNINKTKFDFTVVYDSYYLVIFVCLVIVVYYFMLIILHQTRAKKAFDLSILPNAKIPTELYKLHMTYYTMESLRKRSDIMLRLGIAFGIFGVLVSAFVFQTSNLNLGADWKDPHTLLNILKPLIILLFMETFTFYFLKQYRIIFNEYKLYNSIYIDLLSTNSLMELHEIKDINPELITLLQEKLAKRRYDMYEKESKEKIKEFEYNSAIDILDKLKKQA